MSHVLLIQHKFLKNYFYTDVTKKREIIMSAFFERQPFKMRGHTTLRNRVKDLAIFMITVIMLSGVFNSKMGRYE